MTSHIYVCFKCKPAALSYNNINFLILLFLSQQKHQHYQEHFSRNLCNTLFLNLMKVIKKKLTFVVLCDSLYN